jgi:hypothetical protein
MATMKKFEQSKKDVEPKGMREGSKREEAMDRKQMASMKKAAAHHMKAAEHHTKAHNELMIAVGVKKVPAKKTGMK